MNLIADTGREKILESYFQNNDLYIGLWYNSDTLFSDTNTLSLSGFTDEITNSDYFRIKIVRNKWRFDKREQLIYTVSPIEFNPFSTTWIVTGYFISDTKDNSGSFLDINRFTGEVITLTANGYLKISPKLSIY